MGILIETMIHCDSCVVAFPPYCQEAESQECVWDITSGEYECKVRGEEQTPAMVKFPSER